jgi:HK97 family phage portal protein
MGLSWTDRLRIWLARGIISGRKAAVIPEWAWSGWADPTFRMLVREGYRANGVVFACIFELSLAFQEAKLRVCRETDNGGRNPLPKHPMNMLLRRPNPQMSMSDMLSLTMTYMAIGGDAYWYKVRSRARKVVELVPLSDAQIEPQPGRALLVDHYHQLLENGETEDIPREDIVHFRWTHDPLSPWKGLAPLMAVAREVDTDNEATRYLKALLENDAIPRLALVIPADAVGVDTDRIQKEWQEKRSGHNRGGTAILEGGVDIKRVGMDLQELAFEALRRVPEARICAALRTPAMLVGVNVGLERSTFSNMQECRVYFVEGTMCRFWHMAGETITASLLVPDFGANEDEVAAFDQSTVAALRENQDTKRQWVNLAITGGYMKLNEGRAELGLPADPTGDVYLRSPGIVPVKDNTIPEPEPEPTPPELPPPATPLALLPAPAAATPPEGAPPEPPAAKKALPLPGKVGVTEGERVLGSRLWDELMGEDLAGLLDAGKE